MGTHQGQIFERGLRETPFNPNNILKRQGFPLYLFPYDDALELGSEFKISSNQMYHLIVPDGTWPQAQKIKKRHPELKEIQAVKIPLGTPSRYYLRKSHREGALCTYEAIAKAIGIIEGQEVYKKLMKPFDLMVNQSLEGRGQKVQHHFKFS